MKSLIGKYKRKREAKEGITKKNGYIIVRGHSEKVIHQEIIKEYEDKILIFYICTETRNPCSYWVDKKEWLKQGWKRDK